MDIKEILHAGDQCIQEQPVSCTHACPAHVDVRSMMAKVREGNFTGAFKLYQKQVMFPGIISRICDEPCRRACARNDLDQPLSVRMIEKACVDYTKTKDVIQFVSRGKNGRITIIGGGLSGLSCALNLSRKGYKVRVYEKSHRIGGKLWTMSPQVLPPGVISRELNFLFESENIEIFLNTRTEQLDFAAGDAFYVATGAGGDTFDLAQAENNTVFFNPVSLESSRKGIFVGGSLLAAQDAYSPISSIAQGLVAAQSIERFLKGASLILERNNEHFPETKLPVSIADRERKRAVLPSIPEYGYSKEEAQEEAGRCFLCECKICVTACPFLEHYKEYPKKYITDIQQSLYLFETVAGRLINSCNLCGLCKEVCPTGLDMSEICVSSRRILHRGGKLPPAFHDFWLRDMQFSCGEKCFLSLNPPGLQSSSYMFFPGCQMGASHPEYVTKAYRYLCRRLPSGVALTLGCCGAPAEWAGREDLHNDVLQQVRTNWKRLGNPTVILACPTCHKMFKRYLPEITTVTLWRVIEEYGLPEDTAQAEGVTVAVYDPCSSRYDAPTQESIRALLRAANYRIAEMPYHGQYAQCCSYGGLIAAANPTLAEEIIHKRTSASPYHYVTYCTNCRDTFAADGKPAWHILDLLFGGEAEHYAGRKAPTLSQRRENRMALKTRLLQEIWNVNRKMAKEDYEAINLSISAELEDKMDRERILPDNIRKVVHHAETTGNKLFDPKRRQFIGYLKEGVITYWVEYRPGAASYEVANVYCHRMEIEGGGK